MKKILLSIAVLFTLGFACVGIGAAAGGLDFVKKVNLNDVSKKDPKERMQIIKKEIENFEAIDFNIKTGSIKLLPSTDDKYYISYKGYEQDELSIKNIDKKLTVIQKETEKNTYKNSWSVTSVSKVSVKLNELKNIILDSTEENSSQIIIHSPAYLKDIKLRANVGIIDIKNIKADNLELTQDAGSIYNNKVTVYNMLKATNQAGEIVLKNTKAKDYDLKNSAGGINFYYTKVGNSLSAENSVGEINGSIYYDNINYNINSKTSLGSEHIDRAFYEKADQSGKTVDINLSNNVGSIKLKAYK